MWNWLKRRRRRQLTARPFPANWLNILHRNVAQYRYLPPRLQAKLRDDLRVMIAEKYWEGCRGMTVTDEIKVTVAAQACLLLLGQDDPNYFPQSPTILVYPSVFRDRDNEEFAPSARIAWAGLSVYRGPVILAWDMLLEEGRDCSHGCNLAVHEFAHQLDNSDGLVNGTPDLRDEPQRETWARIMSAEHARLIRDLDEGRETFLGSYAATNETEFFSVSSERFFTLPHELRHHHPALYDLLKGYYRVDPREWFVRAG